MSAWPTGRVVVNHDGPSTPQMLVRGNIGTATMIGKLYKTDLKLCAANAGRGQRITNNIEYFDIHPTCFGRWVTFHSGMELTVWSS